MSSENLDGHNSVQIYIGSDSSSSSRVSVEPNVDTKQKQKMEIIKNVMLKLDLIAPIKYLYDWK